MPRFPSYIGVRHGATPAKLPKKTAPVAVSTAKVSVSAPVAPPAPSKANGKRYFEFVEGSSSKFWEVSVSGLDVTTRWGKIGTGGQSKTKTFASETAAAAEAEKLIEEKTEKGYVAGDG